MARKSPRGCPLDSLVPCQFRLVFGQGNQSFFSVSLSVLRKYFLKFIGNDFLWRRLLAYSATITGQSALMAATSSHQEQCLIRHQPALPMTEVMKTATTVANVCVCVCARQPGNWREGENEPWGGEGGGGDLGRVNLLGLVVGKGREEE